MLPKGIPAALCGFVLCAAPASAKTCTDPFRDDLTYREGGEYIMNTSWYGGYFHGKKTASGKVFNENDLTMVAHKVLPLGTRLRVENLETGVGFDVVVYDDGPHPKGRDLDVSRAAAKKLGVYQPGELELQVTVLDMPENRNCRD